MKKLRNLRSISIYFLIFVIFPVYAAGESESTNKNAIIPAGLEKIWDDSKYISLDEIEPGMEAYCLTEYSSVGIEQFSMDVIDIVRDLDVGKDVIIVKGTDEEFIRTGPVAGCSGSPVYINGRLAGALAFTWTYSTEPLYAATPIEEMLRIDSTRQETKSDNIVLNLDFDAPINFTQVNNNYKKSLQKLTHTKSVSGLNPLPCPLITSGIPAQASRELQNLAEPLGMMIVSGGGYTSTSQANEENRKLVPGATLGVPLVNGDIKLSTVGTVTEVIGDKVYGFGHSLLGFGEIDLPMSTGKVHTIVSNLSTSFKMASVYDTVGSLKFDESNGVIGNIGVMPKTIPLQITIDHCNDSQIRTYDCQIANNELVTPSYLQLAISGAAMQPSDLPAENTVKYNFDIVVENNKVISCSNISTDSGLNDILGECSAVVSLLMSNPFKKLDIKSIDCNIEIMPENISSTIFSVDVSSSNVKAGDIIEVEVILDSYLKGKKKYKQNIQIPENLKPGTYDLSISGSDAYDQFLVKAAPYKFLAQNIPDLIEALNNTLNIPRDKLYFILVLPTSGITLEKAVLPDLPETKSIILQDKKRGINVRPYQHWIEKSIETDTIISSQKVLKITVEE